MRHRGGGTPDHVVLIDNVPVSRLGAIKDAPWQEIFDLGSAERAASLSFEPV